MDSLELKVKFPMILQLDNKGAVDLVNNWSVEVRTRHVETRQVCLRIMKEQGVFQVKWVKGDGNEVDMFTNNFPGPLFEKHCVMFNGNL